MPILDTFVIMFESNHAEVKRGVEETQHAGEKLQEGLHKVGEVGAEGANKITHATREASLSFHEFGERAEEWTKHFVEALAEVTAGFVGLLGVEKLVERFFQTSEANDLLGAQAKMMGVNIEQLDAWGQAVKRVRGSSDGFISSIVTLNENLARTDLMAGSRSTRFFNELGISIYDGVGKVKSGFDLLPELNAKFQNMAASRSLAIGRGIGLDEGTIRLLQLPIHEFDELIHRQHFLGNTTREAAEEAEKFNNQWLDVKQILSGIVTDADTAFLPMLRDLLAHVEHVLDFMREHKDFAVGLFIGLAGAVAILTRGFWLLDAAMWANPWLLVTAAIVALIFLFGLAYDDIKNFIEGHNSLLGEAIKKWPLFGKAVEDFSAIVKSLKPVFTDVKDFILGVLREMGAGLVDFVEESKNIALFLKDLVTDPANAVPNFMRRSEEMQRSSAERHPGMAGAMDQIGKIFTGRPIAADEIPDVGKALLRTIGGAEGADYDTVVGGKIKFSDFSRHPNIEGMPDSHAAGRYQFQPGTFRRMAERLGLKDFSPASQDRAAWQLAQERFFEQFHEPLLPYLQDHGIDEKVSSALSKEWDSLPNGHHPTLSLQQMRKNLTDALHWARGLMQHSSNPLFNSSGGASSLTNNTRQLQIGELHINAPDSEPTSISEVFLEHLQKHYDAVTPNFSNGVEY